MLYNNLKQVRKLSGMSAANISALVGISRQCFYAYERGQYVPSTEIALKIAHVLGVGVHDLFSLTDRWLEPTSPGESRQVLVKLEVPKTMPIEKVQETLKNFEEALGMETPDNEVSLMEVLSQAVKLRSIPRWKEKWE